MTKCRMVEPTGVSRRHVVAGLAALPGLLSPIDGAAMAQGLVRPRLRVILDNDFSGDPDGMFAAAQMLLSQSIDLRAMIGSHLKPRDLFDGSTRQAENGAAKARDFARLLGLQVQPIIVAGRETALTSAAGTPHPAAALIVAEALSTSRLPLYYAAGGGLTDLANAWLIEPRIGKRLILVWIGGPEYDAAPSSAGPEYNLAIDIRAAQVVFNDSDIDIWQVPRDVYRQMLVSHAALLRELKGGNPAQIYLLDQIENLMRRLGKAPPPYDLGFGETYIMGDNPLALLTALQSSFQPDPSSSSYRVRPATMIDDAGAYRPNPKGRPIRVYTKLDTRLVFDDLFAKLRLLPNRAP